MWPRCLVLFIGLLIAAPGANAADGSPWTLIRKRNGIEVFTRHIEGSKYKAVKATMTLHTSLSAVSALVRDKRECPRWQSLCKSAEALKVISPQDLYVYQINDLPWPVSDRDVVAHVIWRQNKKTLAVTMTASAVRGMMPRRKGLVRVTHAETRWTFTPVGRGMVRITTEAHIEPGGPIPAWVVNMLLVKSPFKTLSNMRNILASGRYDNARLNFIKEPTS